MTWAHLEKKQTRLRTNTMTRKDLAYREPRDGVTFCTRRRHTSSSDDVTYLKMASARTDSNTDLEDSYYDGVMIKTRLRRLCPACRYLRRMCTQASVFAAYFPPDQLAKFDNVHKVFGASRVAKILDMLSTSQREDAVNSLAFEADARLKDPVYGPAGLITVLQHSLNQVQGDLHSDNQKLATYMGPSAMMPTLTQSQMGVIGLSVMMPNWTQPQYASM
nr:LOB domain-containing protein 36-like [Tanacetum cinerariifolium]